jgi:hypothetical protein
MGDMNDNDEIRQLCLEARELRVRAANALSEAIQSLELLRRARRERESIQAGYPRGGFRQAVHPHQMIARVKDVRN